MVPIYRQWIGEADRAGEALCGDVCSEADPTQYGCARASFMMGASIGQANHLTMSIPKGSEQSGALYYLDTNARGLGAGLRGLPARGLPQLRVQAAERLCAEALSQGQTAHATRAGGRVLR